MIDELLSKKELTKDDIVSLLHTQNRSDIISIYSFADEVRKKYCGDEVHLRGIVEISNYCEQNCTYCGLREGNRMLPRYRMNTKEILDAVKTINSLNIKTIVLQSGEDSELSSSFIYNLIIAIRSDTDSAITLSLGERSLYEYDIWKKAGADRYLLKHETANPKLYSAFHSGQQLKERLEHLNLLKIVGYQIGSGNLVGLPGQTISDIADDILLCKELNVDMASISPFIPSPATPFRKLMPADLNFVLKVTAVARIVLKNAHMPATTAIGTIDKFGRKKALRVGANVIMPNFTPSPYRERYLIYPDKKCLTHNPHSCKSCLELMINSLGRTISGGRGDSLKEAKNRLQAV